MADRLDAVGEEGLLTLLQDKSEAERAQRRLLLIAYEEDGGAHLEFIAATGEENLQDRIALLDGRTTGELIEIEQEVSLRLLRHLASSVRHQQYYDTDIVTVRVDRPPSKHAGDASTPPILPLQRGGTRGGLTLHHFQAGVEFMAAGHTADAIGFDHGFVVANPHAAAIRAARQVQDFVLEIFVPRRPAGNRWGRRRAARVGTPCSRPGGQCNGDRRSPESLHGSSSPSLSNFPVLAS